MTLTLNSPAVGNVGPGQTVHVHSDTVGPLPVTDIISVQVRPAGGGGNIVSAAIRSNGTHDFTLVVGQDSLVFAQVIGGAQALVGDGSGVTLEMFRYNQFGDVQETGTSTGWTYQSTSALWNLMRGIVTHDPMLDTVLAAVRKPF